MVVIRFVELPLGQELPDLDGLASLFADAPGNRPVESYDGMSYTDMNLYKLVPDTYTSGKAFPASTGAAKQATFTIVRSLQSHWYCRVLLTNRGNIGVCG